MIQRKKLFQYAVDEGFFALYNERNSKNLWKVKKLNCEMFSFICICKKKISIIKNNSLIYLSYHFPFSSFIEYIQLNRLYFFFHCSKHFSNKRNLRKENHRKLLSIQIFPQKSMVIVEINHLVKQKCFSIPIIVNVFNASSNNIFFVLLTGIDKNQFYFQFRLT